MGDFRVGLMDGSLLPDRGGQFHQGHLPQCGRKSGRLVLGARSLELVVPAVAVAAEVHAAPRRSCRRRTPTWSHGRCSGTSPHEIASDACVSASASPIPVGEIRRSPRRPPRPCICSPRGGPFSASAPANAKATSPTGSTGPSRWRASRRRWPPSVRCGTPTGAGQSRLAVLPAAQRTLRPAALQRALAGDLDRRARAPHAARRRALRRRLLPRLSAFAAGIRATARGGAHCRVGRRPRSDGHHARDVDDRVDGPQRARSTRRWTRR